MKPQLATLSLLGVLGCSDPTGPKIRPCDASCTVYLHSYGEERIPQTIYGAEVTGDTIRKDANEFVRRIHFRVELELDGIIRMEIRPKFVIRGDATMRGDSVYLMADGVPHMYGVFTENGMKLMHESVVSDDGRLFHDGNNVFEYRLVR